MRQRAMIAMALACNPSLLIADEPTTALDVTTQAEILDLIRRMQAEYGMGVMFITHDMGVVAEIADQVLVMYRGPRRGVRRRGHDLPRAAGPLHANADRLRAEAGTQGRDPRRPAPHPSRRRSRRCSTISGLQMHFGTAKAPLRAVDDVSLDAAARRDARRRRRVRFRQNHASGAASCASYEPTGGAIAYRRAGRQHASISSTCRQADARRPAGARSA